MDQLSGAEVDSSRQALGDEADDEDSFFEIICRINAAGGVESEGCTFCKCKFVSGHISRGCYRYVSISYMLVFFPPFSLVSICGNNTVSIDIVRELVSSARLSMKRASWGYCNLVFNSSGEPAVLPRFGNFCVPGGSGTEFEVRFTRSREEGANATMNAPMDRQSSIS